MSVVIEPVVPARFPLWVRQRPFAVLFLGQGVRVHRPRQAVQGLAAMVPEQLAVGWMSRDNVPGEGWWSRHWRTELGPYGRGATPPDGVYLFHEGRVAGYHPGTAHAGSDATWHQIRTYLADRIRLKAAQEADDTAWTRSTRRQESRASLPPPKPRDDDPYEILEVDASADDAALKKAFRAAITLNHPDKCQHLSRQIQAFARERTQLILAAWEAIKEERGIR